MLMGQMPMGAECLRQNQIEIGVIDQTPKPRVTATTNSRGIADENRSGSPTKPRRDFSSRRQGTLAGTFECTVGDDYHGRRHGQERGNQHVRPESDNQHIRCQHQLNLFEV